MKKIFLIVPIFFLFACGDSEMRSFNGKELKNISIKKGELFSVRLPENHKAGQTWGIKTWDDRIVEYQKSNYQGEKIGATDFIFDAKTAGTTDLTLNLVEYSHITDSVKISITVAEQ